MKPVYVFDLDGVITNPVDSSVDLDVVATIRRMLHDGYFIAINTGRSYDWVERNFIRNLRESNVSEEDLATRFIAVCEKGGMAVTLAEGEAKTAVSEHALPEAYAEQVKGIFDANAHLYESMFWDETKRTMATIEKLPAADLGLFHEQQKRLVDMLRTRFGPDIQIDATTIATDVEALQAGKYAGAEIIYAWAEQNGAQASFVSFGDSLSDVPMAQCFADKQSSSTFVYVGDAELDSSYEAVHVVRPNSRHAKGTAEYLAAL